MRILEVSSAKNFGGGERHLIDLSRGLTERGHDVFLALSSKSEIEQRADFLSERNIIHFAPRNALDFFAANRIANFIKTNKIDIIHAHLARDYPAASLAARLSASTQFYVSRHVMFPLKKIHRAVLGNVEVAIAVSSGVERVLEGVLPRERIVSIVNGVDTEKYKCKSTKIIAQEFRKDLNINANCPMITIIGELNHLKGQEEFILAAAEIVKKRFDAHFVIAGEDKTVSQSFRRHLKRLVKVMELEKQFTFLNWIEDLSPLLFATDVYVSASHSESFGLAILEAMAAGVAVVATNTDGARELIIEGSSGTIVPIKDSVAMSSSILDLIENEERRKLLSDGARNRARNDFGLSKMIDKTERLFTSRLRAKKAGG